MLVHKRTMGVLSYYWTGEYRTNVMGERLPVLMEYTLAKSGLDPAEWWEVPRNSHLGNALLLCYPCCDPVVDDSGQLVAIKPWPDWADYPERPEGELTREIVAPSQIIPAEMRRKARRDELCPDRTPPKKRRQQRRSGIFAALLK